MTQSKHTSRSTQSPIDKSYLKDSEKISSESVEVSSSWHNKIFKHHRQDDTREPKLLEQVNILIGDNPAKVADVCEKYIALHRIVENTRARRRLEAWITRLIVWYLIIVGLVLIVNALNEWLKEKGCLYICISSNVMMVLLSTTTVNIVALGIILARGLFHENEKDDVEKETTKKKELQ